MKRLLLATVLALAVSSAGIASANAAERELCRFADESLVEISGIASSIRHPGVVWAHNDSGGGPYLYAVNTSDCTIEARLTVAGAQARDYEAIAVSDGSIWLADIGDNLNSWRNVELLKIAEPRKLAEKTVEAVRYRFTYDDMPHDAEAIMVDPRSDQVWVITKQIAHGALYTLPNPLSETSLNIAKRSKRLGGLVTDAAIAPDGSKYVIRDYVDARVYAGLPPGKQTTYFPLPLQLQGEAITWTADSTQLIIASERDRALLLVDVPEPTPEPTPPAEPTNEANGSTPAKPSSGEDTQASPQLPWNQPEVLLILFVGGLGVLGLCIVLVVRRRRV